MADVSTASVDTARRLILASKVNGTPVFNGKRERIGEVDDLAIGKRDGKVAFAILSFGGFLGMGETYHPIPWSILSYNTDLNGYVVSLNKEQLRAAPSYSKAELADVGNMDEPLRDSLDSYYGPLGATPIW
jgi:hypothetical protein